MRHFNPDDRRLTEDDILFNNNANIIVIDQETLAASEADGRFHLRCWYRRLQREATRHRWIWESRTVPWDDLTLDVPGQRIFLENCAAAQAELDDDVLRDELIQQVLSQLPDEQAWSALRSRFAQRGISVPGDYGPSSELRDIVRGIMSAKSGRPIGFGYKKLVEVAHRLFEQRKSALPAFGYTLHIFGHASLLKEQDVKGHWDTKVASVRQGMKSNEPAYRLSDDMQKLVSFVFPFLAEKYRPR